MVRAFTPFTENSSQGTEDCRQTFTKQKSTGIDSAMSPLPAHGHSGVTAGLTRKLSQSQVYEEPLPCPIFPFPSLLHITWYSLFDSGVYLPDEINLCRKMVPTVLHTEDSNGDTDIKNILWPVGEGEGDDLRE